MLNMPGSSVKGRLRRREYRGYVTDREDGDMWKRTRKRRREGETRWVEEPAEKWLAAVQARVTGPVGWFR